MSIEAIYTKTREYVSIPSVVGFEQYFLDYLRHDMEMLGLRTEKKPGLLAVWGSDPHAGVLCAHIDRHGLISLGNGDYVYAAQHMKEIKYGERDPSTAEELTSIARRFEGEAVYAYDPRTGVHLSEGIIRSAADCVARGSPVFRLDDMPEMPIAIPLSYHRKARLEGGELKGQIDNAVSLAVIHELFASGFQGTALFSAEEEIGKSWVFLSEYLNQRRIESKSLLVLDTSPYGAPEPIEQGCVIFRHRDRSAVFNTVLTAKLRARCEEIAIPYQFKDEFLLASGKKIEQLGSTELGKLILRSDDRWSGATIQIPTQMYHTSNETTTTKAVENFFTFLHEILVQKPLEDLRFDTAAQAQQQAEREPVRA